MKCNVTNVYEINHIWELRKWNQVKNVPRSRERNVSLKKKKKTGFRWSPEFFSDFLRNYINWLHNCEDCSLLEWNVNHFKCKPLICFSVRTKKSFDTLISDTLPTAFYYRLAMFFASVRKNQNEKKRKHKMLFSWFSILFMARFMDLWWNKRQISEMKYWNIFSVFVSIHYVTRSIVTKKNWSDFNNSETSSVVLKPKKTAVWQRQLLRRWENGITPREKPFGEEERKKVN